ncbi:MAG: aminopeptidase P family protein [Saprospiraceae bacterium]
MNDIQSRLTELRRVMQSHKIDATIIPSNDPHQSEYVSSHWQERAWISGFNGSAGIVVVTQDHAGLWTDSRYFLQAEMELKDTGFTLHKMYNQFGTPYVDFLKETLKQNSAVSVNGYMFSRNSLLTLQNAFEGKGIRILHDVDLIASIWKDRPENSKDPIFLHETVYAGASIEEKIKGIQDEMVKLGGQWHFLSALDDIAWTFNIRGADVAYNPVAIAYAVIGKAGSHLFIDSVKVPKELFAYFKKANVKLHPYDEINSFLSKLPKRSMLLADLNGMSQKLFDAVNCKILDQASIPKWKKAIKSSTEIAYLRNTMAKDGAALAKTFYWLEKSLKKKAKINECDVADALATNRSKQPLYFGESFAAIVGYNSNGAIIHYHPQKETCKEILPEGILLVDSGGQYHDGTTDITRTFALDKPESEHKVNYTNVLKGMMAVARTIFPEGTTGIQLDTLARQFLWATGLNYGHGTGHGVGYFLNVHEPPQGIAPSFAERGKTVHEVGMLTSDEPGYYKEGHYGIRIENLVVVSQSDYKGFLEFETLTLYPFDHDLIDMKLLTNEEIKWINAYHKKCFKKISPLLSDNVKDWFKRKCRKLSKSKGK